MKFVPRPILAALRVTSFVVLALAAATRAQADVPSIIASNPFTSLQTQPGGGTATGQTVFRATGPGGASDWYAARAALPFSTGASNWTFAGATLNLALVSGASSDLSVSLWSGTNTAPASRIATLTAPTIAGQADYLFTTASSIALTANTTYWIVAEPSLSSNVSVQWFFGDNPGTYGDATRYASSSDWGVFLPVAVAHTLAYSILGTPTAPVSLPFATIKSFASADGGGSNNPLAFRSDGKIFGATTVGGAFGFGTVYSLNADGSGFTVLKHFDGTTSGADCRGGVILGTDGRLYGATASGGSAGNGTIFRVDADGQNFTVLRHMSSPDGKAIWAGLVQGPDGLLYGASTVSNNWGTAFRIRTDGTGFEVLRDFGSGPNGGLMTGVRPFGTPAFGPDGMIYGTTYGGGSYGYGVIYRMNANGTGYTVLKNLEGAGSTGGAWPFAGVLVTSDGTLFGTTTDGGNAGVTTNSGGVVYRLSPNGAGYTYSVVHHLMSANPEGRNGDLAVPILAGGRLYASAGFNGAGGSGSVFSLNPDGSDFRVEASFNGGADGGNPLAGVRQSPDGALYGTTRNGGANGSGTIFRLGTPTPLVSAPVITSATNAGGGYGTAFTYTITATNSPTSFGASNLPNGLNFSTSTGTIAGTLPGTPGSYVIGLSATNAGGTGTTTLTLTVIDTTLPVITAPSLLTAEATGPTGAPITFTATATDAISGPATVTATPPSGSTFALGLSSVSLSATDAAGNTATKGIVVQITDTTPPALTLPANIAAEATSASGAVVNFSASASDLVSGSVSVTLTPGSGSTFAIGTTTVNAVAKDAANNTATGSFTVTVRDTTPPVITSVTPSITSIWPPNKKMVPVTITVAATDAVGIASATIVSVATNQPDQKTQWQITGPLTVNLLADRNGDDKDRIYTITIAVRDAAGNATTTTTTVTVPHDQGNEREDGKELKDGKDDQGEKSGKDDKAGKDK